MPECSGLQSILVISDPALAFLNTHLDPHCLFSVSLFSNHVLINVIISPLASFTPLIQPLSPNPEYQFPTKVTICQLHRKRQSSSGSGSFRDLHLKYLNYLKFPNSNVTLGRGRILLFGASSLSYRLLLLFWVWSEDQQLWHRLGAHQDCRLSGLLQADWVRICIPTRPQFCHMCVNVSWVLLHPVAQTTMWMRFQGCLLKCPWLGSAPRELTQ